MAAESDADSFFRPSLAVGRGGVEVIDPMLEGDIDESVHLFLIDEVLPGVVKVRLGRPSHASVAEQRYLLAGLGIDAVGHLVGGDRGLGQLFVSCLSIFFT